MSSKRNRDFTYRDSGIEEIFGRLLSQEDCEKVGEIVVQLDEKFSCYADTLAELISVFFLIGVLAGILFGIQHLWTQIHPRNPVPTYQDIQKLDYDYVIEDKVFGEIFDKKIQM